MFKKLTNLLSDSASFWLAFFLVFVLRRSGLPFAQQLLPFAIVFFLNLFVFYAFGLYEERKNEWLFPGLAAIAIGFFVSIIFFYFFSRFYPGVAPRGSLLLFFAIFGGGFIFFRMLLENLMISKYSEKIVVLTENESLLTKLKQEAENFNFEILALPRMFIDDASLFEKTIKNEKIKTLIADLESGNPKLYRQAINLKLEVFNPETFFEKRLKKIYSEKLSLDFLNRTGFRPAKEITQKVAAAVLIVAGLPLWISIFVLVKIFSPGPVIFRQKRVGLNGRIFEAFKFRTMVRDAEKDGPAWAAENDPRITPIGKVIRWAHLDELPQLINIFKGEMFFVGPRPERPEFTKDLEQRIPLFPLRRLIKPGLTGWAQINYPYGASIEDAKNKLEYDLYYLKNQSLFLDLVILIKTFKFLFFNLSRR